MVPSYQFKKDKYALEMTVGDEGPVEGGWGEQQAGWLNTSNHQTIKTKLAHLLPISLDAVFRAKAWRWRKMRETLEPD